MSGRTFAQINCGLLKSQKMRALGHAEKWVYLCAHLTPFASFSGVFHYPTVMWAHDACLPPAEFAAARARLVEVGLIEHDENEEVVRIVGFHRQRPPENASRSIALIGDFQSSLAETSGDAGLILRSIAEFAVSAVARAQSWKPDSTDMPKLREALRVFLATIYQDAGDDLLIALASEIEAASKAVRAEMGALFPPLTAPRHDTLSAPCPQGGGTRDLDLDVDETRLRRDRYEDKDEDEDKTTRLRATCEAEAWPHAEKSEGLRKGANGGVAPISGPLPSTLSSRIALQSMASTQSGKGN